MTLNPFWHGATTAVACLVSLLVLGHWVWGGLLSVGFYAGREVAQAEYRWIERFGEGRRAGMPWWGGFDKRVWGFKSLWDCLSPIAVVLVLWLST